MHPARADQQIRLLGGRARVGRPSAVANVNAAVGAHPPNGQRQRLGQALQTFLPAALELAKLVLMQARRLLADLLLAQVKFQEDANFGAQNLRLERLKKVVDGTGRISGEYLRVVATGRRNEDDRHVGESRMRSDHGRELETARAGHLNVKYRNRDVLREKLAQRFLCARGGDDRLAEGLERGFERYEIARTVIDHENRGPRIGPDGRHAGRPGAAVLT